MVRPRNRLKEEIRYEIIGILMLVFAFLSLLSLYTTRLNTWAFRQPALGTLGGFIMRGLAGLAGEGRYGIPLLLALVGLKLIWERRHYSFSWRSIGVVSGYLTYLTWLHLDLLILRDTGLIVKQGWAGAGGGFLGAILALLLDGLFGPVGTRIILITAFVVSALLITNISLVYLTTVVAKKFAFVYIGMRHWLSSFLFTVAEDDEEVALASAPTEALNQRGTPLVIEHHQKKMGKQATFDPEVSATKQGDHQPIIKLYPLVEEEKVKSGEAKIKTVSRPEKNDTADEAARDDFVLPPLSLLQRALYLKNPRLSKDITDKVKLLEETLDSFGVKVRVTQVSCGPSVTRYEVQPAPGIKVSKIVSLADDIALSLAAPGVRIEAPIPGKAAVGIEVPNKEIAVVHLREVLETPEFQRPVSKLLIGLGKDIAGNPAVSDLSKMPHLLIAGATGSGKSVCLNSLICSFLFRCKPAELKILMIDPKMVELTNYNGIPHLITPVVTDAKKAATALRWMISEMENRYAQFAAAGVRDIARFNNLRAKESLFSAEPALPFVVVIIDELADLMMVAPIDVEDSVCRLAQKARAAGIHLVVATQRPSVDVITGLIKANIPSRIAFAVSSQIDSRTILDTGGAEKLLGRGDMLFLPVGAAKPVRLQGVFVSDKEVEDIVQFLKKQGEPTETEIPDIEEQETRAPEEDALFTEAVRLLLESGQASISLLQRRLHIGYTRAARLIDMMEDRGIVSGYEGSKPRTVLINWDDYRKLFGKRS